MSAAEFVTDGVHLEIPIAASTETVWRSLTEGIGEWWPSEFFIGGEEGRRSYHLEPWPGGRMYEEWEGGGGLLWGLVVTAIPGSMLQVNGFTFPQWGGPSVLFGTWSLEAAAEGCTLKLDEQALGQTPDHHVSEKVKGWTFLMETMKAHLEGTPKPKWQD